MSKIDLTWLGLPPSYWKQLKLRQILKPFSEKNHADLPLLSVVREKGVIVRDIENDDNHNFIPDDLSDYKLVKVGQFAMNKMKAWQGSYGVSKFTGIVSPAYLVFDFNYDIDVDFFNYAIRCKKYVSFFGQASDGIRVGQWDLSMQRMKEIPFYLPPRPEQDQIVRFLDWKVSRINKLINIKKKEIKELQLIRQSYIDSELSNKNQSKEESKNWIVRPLKYFVTSNDDSLSNQTDDEYELDYLDISSVGRNYLKQNPVHYKFKDAPSRARRKVQEGDTIISTVRTYLRSMIYIDEQLQDCIVSTGFSVLRPKRDVYPRLLNYVLSGNQFIDEVICNSIGVSYPAINDTDLLRIKVALPVSLELQKKMVEKLESKLRNIDKLIDVVSKQIDELHNLKNTLISDVVTGQIDVRDVEIPNFEFEDESLDFSEDGLEVEVAEEED